MNKIKLLLLLLMMTATSVSYAHDLSQEEVTALQERVKYKVEEFQRNLGSIVDNRLSANRRHAALETTLALFMGNGDVYYVNNEYNEREKRGPVRIEVSSVNRMKISKNPIKEYLNNQYKNLHKYTKVEIDSVDAVRVDNIYKVGENQYECMAYFCQKYISYGPDGTVRYGDISKKKVKVHITAREIPTVGIVFDAKLGDIYVTETKRL